ncbi:TetR/AcrR family transcriptional regulator [Streptomyces sp. NPDC127084]|uniref:TetR/AcrR family transcriptional regulator n=1 Tax=Streptomyces sp. NPDC127084 TaxID=3347133 RepID=UPI003648945F
MGDRAPYRKKHEVREQILVAAEELFARRLPSEVSIRDIAEHAGLQHSLVHRHFAGKDRLIEEVVRRTVERYAAVVAETDDPAEGFVRGMRHMADHRASLVALMDVLMDPADPRAEISMSPGFEMHRKQFSGPEHTGDDLRLLIVALMAFTSGWAFLEGQWMAAGGFGPDELDSVRAGVAGIITRIIERETDGDGRAH